ncbi:2TM domain-containing protein [Imtechella halotolerans]|uniref:2TM domain-containing protein n=2 Tax=Imtechella TaxID=1165076 RepID=I0WGJ8_9FLAO|nr:2TM domain-containing protein [Imtechella halotolerans]EID75514.1 hypothetical protein W5A_04848 [Imtechella halotolerans K1]
MKKHLKTGNRLTMEQKEYHKEDRYLQAVERVKEIKGFYTHLLVYILINCMLLWLNTKGFKEPLFEIDNFYTIFFWGIGLVFHAWGVFGKGLLFSKDWEARKIKEFMKEDQYNKWE